MKRIVIYSLVGLLAASLSGATTYALAYNQSNNNNLNQNTSSESSSTDYGPSYYDPDAGKVPTGFAGLIYNLTSKGDMAINDLTVSLNGNIDGKATDTLTLGFSDGNVDYNDTSALKLKSALSVKYGTASNYLSTGFNVDYESGDYAYFSFVDGAKAEQKLMMKAPSTLGGITTLLNGIISTPDFDTDGLLSDLMGVLPSFTSALDTDAINNTMQTLADGSFRFTINFGNIDIPIGEDTVSLTNFNVILGCDSNYYFNYVGLPEGNTLGISYASGESTTSINLGLEGSFTQVTAASGNSSTFVGMTDEEKSAYTDISSVYTTANSLCEVIADIANKKVDGEDNPNYRKFTSALSIKADYPVEDATDLDLTGSLSADLSKITNKDDFEMGAFELNLTKKYDNPNKASSKGTVLFKDGTSYLKLNDTIKGKVSNTSLENIISLAGSMTTEPTKEEVIAQQGASVLSLSALIAQAKDNPYIIGRYVPSSLVSGFEYSKTYIGFGLNGKALGMDDEVMSIKINTSEDGTFRSFSIENISVGGVVISLELDLSAGYAFTLDPTSVEFDDYSGVSSLFNSVNKFYKLFTDSENSDSNAFKVNYQMNLASSTNGTNYQVKGAIEGDTTGLDLADKDNTDYGKYHISSSLIDTKRNTTSGIDAYYQDKAIYLESNHGVIKNSLTDTCTAELVDLVNSKSGVSTSSLDKTTTTSSMQSAMDKVTDLFGDGAFLKDLYSMMAGDFNSLSNYFTVANGTDVEGNKTADKVIITLNLKAITADSSSLADYCKDISSLAIEFDNQNDYLSAISLTGLKYTKDGVLSDDSDNYAATADMTLSFDNTDSLTYTPLTSEKTSQFVAADNAIDAFINLPSDNEKFGLNLTASLGATSMSGFANVDRTLTNAAEQSTPAAKGNLTVLEPLKDNKTQTHSINFSYQSSGTHMSSSYMGYTPEEGMSVADYNGNMHLRLSNSSIFEIVDAVSNVSDTNLLNPSQLLAHYTTTTSEVVNGLSITDIIANKDYLHLLDNYILAAQVNSSDIVLKLNPMLFNGTDDSANPYTLTIGYENTAAEGADAHYSVTGATLEAKLGDSTMSIVISRDAYATKASPEVMAYTEANEGEFIDLDNLPTFVKMGLNTTEQSYFYLTGALLVNVTILSGKAVDLNAYFMAKVKVEDKKTKAYIYVLAYNKNNNSSASTDPTTEGFYATEFFVDEDMAYVCQTHTEIVKSGFLNLTKTKTVFSQNFKVTREELIGDTNRMVYYILDFILNVKEASFGELIDCEVFSNIGSSSTAVVNHDYSQYIDSAVYDANNCKYTLQLNLGDMVDLGSTLKLQTVGITVNHTSGGTNLLSEVHIGDVDSNQTCNVISIASGLVKASVAFTVNLHMGATEDLTRYNNYIAAFKADSDMSALDYYHINSVSSGTILTGSSISDNGQYITRKYTNMSGLDVFVCPNYGSF